MTHTLRALCLLFCLLAVGTEDCIAGDPPQALTTDPQVPRTDESFYVNYPTLYCGDFFSGLDADRTIERIGSTIRITAEYRPSFCFPGQFYPPSFRWEVQPMPAGLYRLELYGYLQELPNQPFLKGFGTVVVAGGAGVSPTVVPVFEGWAGRLAMILLVVLIGLLAGPRAQSFD